MENSSTAAATPARRTGRRTLAERRPMQSVAMYLRKAPLAALHRQQIQLWREWRMGKDLDGTTTSRTNVLSDLFLSVNAIAGGIRNTG